jgi:hypothetical protein
MVSLHPRVSVGGSVVSAPLEDEPGWDCRVHGNRVCGGDQT